MNTTAITGTVATVPRYRIRGFVPTTTFDIHVDFAHRTYMFHLRATNHLAKQSRPFQVDDRVAITGYLHADPYDMPDRSIWHRIEIVAHEIEHRASVTRDEQKVRL